MLNLKQFGIFFQETKLSNCMLSSV